MAEVKVKITAQNEVRTGLQQALQETQKFSQQAKAAVSQKITTNPFAGDDRLGPLRDLQRQARELRELARAPIDAAPQALGGPELAQTSSAGASAIRGLAADLANATSAGDVFEAVVRRITTAFGGLVAAAGGFAIGSLIRRTLEDAAAGLNQLIDQSQALQNSFGALSAPTTSFDQLATAINGAAQQIEALEDANRKLQSGIGFQIADYINSFDLSAAANAETDAAVGNARGLLGSAILNATRRELELAKARTEEERKLIELQANREQFLAKARGLGLERQALQLFDAQDGRTAGDRERILQAQADKQRAINEDNRRSLEERLAREKQGLADLQQFGGAGIQLRRAEAEGRIDQLQKQIESERERATAAAARGATVAINATGLNSIQDLRAALDEVQPRQVDVILNALGVETIAEAKAQLDTLDASAQAAIDRAEATKRELARTTAAQSLQGAIEQREFAGLSPEEQQAKIEADQAALIAGFESGQISPADAAQRALELANRQQALDGGGAAGSFGASSLQRIGFASNEFFDTRQKKDPAEATERATVIIREIFNILKKGEPLVLPSTN